MTKHLCPSVSFQYLCLADCIVPVDYQHLHLTGIKQCWPLQVAQPSMSPLLFKILTSVLRTGNNVVGGISFVTLAKLFGVQSSKGDEVKQVAKQDHTAHA